MDATQRVRAMLSFVQAADRGSFAAAARALGISAAAVGKNVAGLEAALGVRLMNRSTRSLQLTAEGTAFLDGAREAIDALDAAIDGVAAQRATPSGRVRISVGSAFGRRYLLPLLPGLLKRYPALIPEVAFDDRHVDLVRDAFDLALRGGHLADSSLVSRQVCKLHVVLVASPKYLARAGVPRTLAELTRHRFISVRFLNGTTSDWRFRMPDGGFQAFRPEPASIILSDPEAATEAAVAGLGIVQAGLHHAWPHLRAGRLQVLLPELHDAGQRELALQYPHRALVAPRVRATVEYLMTELGKQEALHTGPEQLQPFWA